MTLVIVTRYRFSVKKKRDEILPRSQYTISIVGRNRDRKITFSTSDQQVFVAQNSGFESGVEWTGWSVFHRGCAYTVLQTVHSDTMHYKEPLKSFDMSRA